MYPLVAVEAMPPAVRTTGSNAAYNVGVAAIMGPIVVIALQLTEWFGRVAPPYYGAFLGVISIAAALIWRKRLEPDTAFLANAERAEISKVGQPGPEPASDLSPTGTRAACQD